MKTTGTSNPPFGEIKHLLSDKPLQRPKLPNESDEQYIARITPSKKTLRKLAKKFPPPQSWYDGDEPKPF